MPRTAELSEAVTSTGPGMAAGAVRLGSEEVKPGGVDPEVLKPEGVDSEVLKPEGVDSEVLNREGADSEVLKL